MPSTKKSKARFLDVFYELYPEEYEAGYHYNQDTQELYKSFMSDFPTEFDHAMMEYDRRFVS